MNMNMNARPRSPVIFFLALMLTIFCMASPAAETRRPAALKGRIFFTAAERRAMETKPVIPEPSPPSPPAAPPVQRRFDGALWREGRIVVLWFDSNPVNPASEPSIRLNNGTPGTRRNQNLQPGQVWPPQEGRTQP
jgi:hypothetical protein